jgi:hypothetical protein
MTKQDLIDALTSLGVSFEKTQSIKELKDLYETAQTKTTKPVNLGSAVAETAKYVKNTSNGRVFIANQSLMRMSEMVAISESEYQQAIKG